MNVSEIVEGLEKAYKETVIIVAAYYEHNGLSGKDLMNALLGDPTLESLMNKIIEIKGAESGFSIVLSKDEAKLFGYNEAAKKT